MQFCWTLKLGHLMIHCEKKKKKNWMFLLSKVFLEGKGTPCSLEDINQVNKSSHEPSTLINQHN